MKLITANTTPFKDQRFAVELTGEELAVIHRLSYLGEGGESFATSDQMRICGKIEAMFPQIKFRQLSEQLVNGKLPWFTPFKA